MSQREQEERGQQDEEELIRVCLYCHGSIQMVGEDLIDYCTNGCGCIEGEKDCYITIEEYERG